MCFLSGKPVPHNRNPKLDEFNETNARQWETDMLHAPCNHPLGCCIGCFCPPCFACYLRHEVLQGDMTKYMCCQRYICPSCTEKCCKTFEDSCPFLCLCLEATICECFAISATRIYLQEERQIMTDPCDNRIIRFNNIIQILACVCQILAIIDNSFQACADMMRFIADVVYAITSSCMQAQTHLELLRHPTPADYDALPGGGVMSSPPRPQQQGQQPPKYNQTAAQHAGGAHSPTGYGGGGGGNPYGQPQQHGGYNQPQQYQPQAGPPPGAYPQQGYNQQYPPQQQGGYGYGGGPPQYQQQYGGGGYPQQQQYPPQQPQRRY